MTERPILFSGPMVSAILSGNKTQTRRVVKYANDMEFDERDPGYGPYWRSYIDCPDDDNKALCPYGRPGDRLWVRETFVVTNQDRPVYRADFRDTRGDYWSSLANNPEDVKWKPSIFMPRERSRITLEITGVRVERLHEITEDDALAEGITPESAATYAAETTRPYGFAFRELWMDINEKRAPWDQNPWVWVLEFRRVKP